MNQIAHLPLEDPSKAPPRRRVAFGLASSMLLTAIGAQWAKPSKFLSDARPRIEIEPQLPRKFSNWEMELVSSGVVNPQQAELINTLYAEVINRVYVNRLGQRIMLSIAYGKNQHDQLEAHKPEICYPAQGFQLKSIKRGITITPFGRINVKRLETNYGPRRPEPVTYWTTLGDHVIVDYTDKRLEEIRYSLRGYIADGLLFRVSSIDDNTDRAFRLHDAFISELLAALRPEQRSRLAGLQR